MTTLIRFTVAVALTFGTIALCSSAQAQMPSSQDPAATAAPQQQSSSSTQEPTSNSPASTSQEPTAPAASDPVATSRQNEAQMPAAGNQAQTQDARAFTGQIVKQNGKVVLMDPVTKTTYGIDDASKVKSYIGKQVKVTGKLDMDSNMIHVTSIEQMTSE